MEKVSSRRLAEDLAVDASQIAKDLSFLKIKGKTRIGYDLAELEETLKQFLGFASTHNAVMVGAGSLGAALMCDSGLNHYGLNIVARHRHQSSAGRYMYKRNSGISAV